MIEYAIQRGNYVFVYGKGDHYMFTKPGELIGFTSSTVTVKSCGIYSTFNDKGHLVSTRC